MSILFEKICKNISEHPDFTVFIDADKSAFTFAELDSFARKVAHKLSLSGVGKGDFVTIELPKCKEFTAAVWGVWLAGAAYAPLSPTYPEERIQFIRENCHAAAVIDEKFLKHIEAEPLFEGTPAPDADDPALLIYTSGSTGNPKGVLHTHRSVEDAVLRFNEYVNLPAGSVTALAAPFAFIVSLHDIFMPLSECFTGYIMPLEVMRDPVLLADFIEENGINFTFISPKMLKVFEPKGESLKTVYTGSERVSDTYSEKFELIVMLGQTETAGATLGFKVDKPYANTPIGKPMGNIRAHILDENGNEAEEGELCFAGYFAREYLGLPAQSAETMTDNPFAAEDGFDKLLRTGDIVRRGEDGNIIYLNRKDWMVKINGQRVEPGEIETLIKAVPGIHDACIKDFKNQYGQVYLCAYFVQKEPVEEEDIKAFIGEKLPAYMIPAFFIKLEKLPVNANGKLDRSALKAPEAGNYKGDYVAPETDMQKALCAAFESVLGVKDIGIEDDFFALGGDSIKCAMVAAQCEVYKISTADIFAGKTPLMIERLLLQKAGRKTLVKKSETPRIYALTPFERGMYIEQKLNPDSVVYNLNICAVIHGADAAQIETALQTVFASHEAFHSFYSEQNGLPVRVLTDKTPGITHKTAATVEAALEEADNYNIPFNLNEAIPVKPFLYTVEDGAFVLHLALHHIAFDGGSADTYIKELFECLQGKKTAEGAIDLSDIYDRQFHTDSGLAFYKELFADGVPVNDMPLKGKRPKVHPLSDKKLRFTYSAKELESIDKTARRYGVTEFELIFSAVAMALGKYTVSEDVVLGIPTNMRPNGADDVIGMFVNTAPLRVKPVRNMAVREYLKTTGEAVRRVTYGAALPFEDVVAEFVKQRDESRNPMFDVSVNYMWSPASYEAGELKVEAHTALQSMGRDIGVVIHKSESGLEFILQYSTALFEDAVIENFAAQIRSCLEKMASDDTKTLRDAMALPAAQMEQMEAFSTEGTGEVPITLLHEMFEHAVEQYADKTALIASDATLTYKELNERANIVAHNLIEKGIKVGDSVALLLPRESCFFSCLFGVNKAGAAFIPCDPQYPADRINHIVSDSEASYIITTADKIGEYPPEKAILVDDIVRGDKRENPGIAMSDEELAYMIYTSGSTGKPKGVMLRHCGICNYLSDFPTNTIMHNIVTRASTYISVTTISFDMSFKEHTASLCHGKTLIFTAEDEMNDPRALAELMQKYGADCINATPSRLEQYMEYAPFKEALGGCKLIMSGGEGYPLSLRDALRECAPDAVIVNTYGPTEITVSSNAMNLTQEKYVSIGRPLTNYKEYIVDKFGDIAPYGVIGELYIGGVGVAKGYKNLPEKTKEVFITYRGERMYRSGDYSKWDARGNVLILGRIDNQVKLRGLRIELGEIEGLIAVQPHIKKVAVVIRKLNGQDNLCAYFAADTQIDVDALREELKQHLTPYMVPTAYLQMAELPMTANGKTDIKHLPEPVPVSLGEYVEPEGETETFFCETFKKVLKLEKVGATDDFFEIGGTSLVASSVVLEASENGFEITYGDIFKYTTPRQLAKLFAEGEIEESSGMFDFEGYDYAKIDALLAKNTVESFTAGETRALGNILITGATGYMGAHLLAQYLEEEKGTAYCMLRKGQFEDAKQRLQNLMYYYFDDRFEEELATRVEVFNGDVTDYKFFEVFEKEPIDTVFNCAANVKHFSNGTDIEDINVGGAVNCAKLCEKIGARLIHFSTVSVAGTTLEPEKLSKSVLDERTLYFGQTLDNKYTSSKLMAERMVLEAAAEKGLDAKVIRVGTLAARESDGEFQINFLTNNFMGRLRSYSMLGCFPYSMIENQVCMGPIDTSCAAFLKLARTPQACCLFNAINNHTLPLGDIIRRMNKNGMDIRFVEYDEFVDALETAQQDPEKAAILSSMTAYMNMGHGKQVITLPAQAHYTTQILARMGFFWNAGNEKYVDDFIGVLQGFRFFEKDNLIR